MKFRLFFLISITIFISCNNSPGTSPTNKGYDGVIDSTNHLVEARKDDQALRYIDSVTNLYQTFTLIQQFRYLSINYNYYFHIKNDYDRSMAYADSILALFDTPEKKVKYLSQYDQTFF